MMKFYIPFLFLVIPLNIFSQKAGDWKISASESQTEKHWSIGVNPLSLAESQLSLGPCVAYRFSERIELWAEASYIFANSYMPKEWKNMSGFRFILQPRYFMGYNKTFFIAPEFRIKNYSFNNRLEFVNTTTRDTLHNFAFREDQTLAGGALVFGKKYLVSAKHNINLELTFGIGSRQRNIKRKNVPAGYNYLYGTRHYALAPTYEDDRSQAPYFPLGVRFIWNLK